jgi:hypothetical protein
MNYWLGSDRTDADNGVGTNRMKRLTFTEQVPLFSERKPRKIIMHLSDERMRALKDFFERDGMEMENDFFERAWEFGSISDCVDDILEQEFTDEDKRSRRLEKESLRDILGWREYSMRVKDIINSMIDDQLGLNN